MKPIKIYLPSHVNGCNSHLLSNCFLKSLKNRNIKSEIVEDIDLIKPNDIVIYRFGSEIYKGSLANTEQCSIENYKLINSLENKGCLCYPSAELMKYYENKVQLYYLFLDKNIKIPTSFLINNFNSYSDLRDEIKKHLPVIIKHCYSCSSNNIQQAFTIDELDNKIKQYYKKNSSIILIQKKIQFTREARLTYIGNNIYHAYYRIKNSSEDVSGATNYGSTISFTVDTKKLTPFITKFVEMTKFYIGGIDIVWENDNLDSEPYVLEVSPIYDINPPPIGKFIYKPYSSFKTSEFYENEKQKIYQLASDNIIDYILEINNRPTLLVDIDCTLSDSEPRIKKWAKDEAYKKYEHILCDLPIENSQRVLNKLYEKYKIIIITSRKSFPEGLFSTKDWLYIHNYSYHQLILVNDLREKTLYYNNKNTDILIDDFTTNHHINTIDDTRNLEYFKENGFKYIKFDKNNSNWLYIEKSLCN